MKTIDHYPFFAHDKRGVGLIFALVSVVLLSVIMTVFYEIVIPRSKNVKGIEESNVAAYQAESGIEASLMMMSGATPVESVQSGSTA
jgi:Tfp pilus assembly protein PilV